MNYTKSGLFWSACRRLFTPLLRRRQHCVDAVGTANFLTCFFGIKSAPSLRKQSLPSSEPRMCRYAANKQLSDQSRDLAALFIAGSHYCHDSHRVVLRGSSRAPAPLTSADLSGKNVDQSQQTSRSGMCTLDLEKFRAC